MVCGYLLNVNNESLRTDQISFVIVPWTLPRPCFRRRRPSSIHMECLTIHENTQNMTPSCASSTTYDVQVEDPHEFSL